VILLDFFHLGNDSLKRYALLNDRILLQIRCSEFPSRLQVKGLKIEWHCYAQPAVLMKVAERLLQFWLIRDRCSVN